MIRVVLDTNVVVSALLWGGKPRLILEAARVKRLELVTMRELTSELWDVILRDKFEKPVNRQKASRARLVEDGYLQVVTLIESVPIVPIVFDDPDDDAVIACAVAADADYIVTGDEHLLSMGEYQGITICTVDDFVSLVMPQLR